jgi:hypothetical protein
VVTFKRDDTPPRLREWLFREIFKVADAKGISFERRGDRLHAPLAELQRVFWLVRGISKHAQLSEGAKAYLAELEAAETAERQEASEHFRAGLEADMQRRRDRRFGR